MKILFDPNITDYSEIFFRAFSRCKDGETVDLEEGTYRISSEHAFCKPLYLSNNDFVEKKVAVLLFGKKNITINGNGARLLFVDFFSGIGIADCENIRISGLHLDYADNYHIEWEIEEVFADRVQLKPRDGFDFSVRNGRIFTKLGLVENGLCMAFDTATNAPCFRNAFVFLHFGAEEDGKHIVAVPYTENGVLYLQTAWASRLRKGSVLVACYMRKRYHQAVFVTHSRNVSLCDTEIAYSPSMGIIAQLSENIFLDGVRIKPNGRHGMLSSVCDATHFVQCSGKVTMRNCKFFNMMDDAVNIHGNYLRVESVENDWITAQIMHCQQRGVNVFFTGDTLTVYAQDTVDTRQTFIVTESVMPDESRVLLRVDGDPAVVRTGDVLCNIERMPEVEISDVACGRNRPRGFLLNTSRKCVVTNCEFSNSEHGIELAGDTNYWYESGRCCDVMVENCTFRNCNHAAGDYAVMIRPIFNADGKEKYYHKNVTIRNNVFRGFQNGMVFARHVDGISVYNNIFEREGTYPARTVPYGKLRLIDCRVEKTENNIDREELLSLLAPVWKGNAVVEQTAVFVSEKDAAPLLFAPVGNVTVTDYAKQTVYEYGTDYVVRNGTVVRQNGAIPYYTAEEFYRLSPDRICVPVNVKKQPFTDGKARYFKFGALHERTVRISYECVQKSDIFGISGKKGCCARFKAKMQKGNSATVVFYGDSITEGANASAQLKIPPYQETWPQAVVSFLRLFYENENLRYVNTAVGGKDSVWGAENFGRNVSVYAPDLLVLGFGMNDGSKIPQEYYALADKMLAQLKSDLPDCDVITVATSVPNPQSTWYGNQFRFVDELRALSQKYGCSVVDMTSLSLKLYGDDGRIRYRDFSGNNVNHPNDFGVRLHAQAFLNELLGEEYEQYFTGLER